MPDIFFRRFFAVALFNVAFRPVCVVAMEQKINPDFEAVRKRLVKDGFSPERLESIFSDPEVFFDAKNVSLFFIHLEGSLNYKQFATRTSISRAKAYMDKHRKTLDLAKKKHGSSPEVITAIILVESRFGKIVGNSSVLNVLLTLSSLSDKKARDMLWIKTPAKKRLSRKKFKQKALKKSNWAYKELKAFLTHTRKEKIDPVKIRGSYAGAMGIPQFMPSNILTLARDGDMDGKIDLFSHADAIMSVASYLKHHGWRSGIARKKARKVIFAYNRSVYYVDAILGVAKLLGSQEAGH